MLLRLTVLSALAASAVVPLEVGTTHAAAPDPAPRVKALAKPDRVMARQGSFDPHTVLVRFRAGTSAAARGKALAARGARSVAADRRSGYVEVRTEGAAADLVKQLRGDPAVQTVSLDYRRRLSAAPNDPAYVSGDQPYLSTVRLPQAWDVVKDSSAQVIAVLDTGVDTGHPDLAGRTVAPYNAVDGGTSVSDTEGHGTMVAGIAAASTNNGEGIAGAAWGGRIMPVKVFSDDGSAYDSDIARGITWAADHGAKIINLSLGGPDDSPVLRDAIQYAVNSGVVVVAAAGNTGLNAPEYPAAYPEVVAVGATDASGRLTDFSTWGDWIDLAAPGWDIVSTFPRASGYDYASGAGTSFSAPLVSGIAALVRTRFPSYTPAQVAAQLKLTARDAGPRGIDPYYGFGFVDAFHALGGARAADLPPGAPDSSEPNDVPVRAAAITSSVSATLGAEGDVDWYRYDSDAVVPAKITVTPPPASDLRPQNLDPVLAVYDSDLRLIGTTDKAGAGSPEQLTLNVGKGTTYVAVRNGNGALDTRPYTVQVVAEKPSLFAPAQRISIDSRAESVAIGDVTGDGRNDIVLNVTIKSFSSNPTADNKLTILAQEPDGSLATPVRYPANAYASGVALLDADGDQRLDVALATPTGVQIFGQTDTGTLTDHGTVVGSTAAKRIVAADIDADGDTDLVTSGAQGTYVLIQTPDHTFEQQTVSTYEQQEVEVGDVDGDGTADIVGFSTSVVNVYHRRDTGWVVTVHHRVSDTGGDIKGIEVADLNGDGRSDIAATVNTSPGVVNVFLQSADGTLGDPVVYAEIEFPQSTEAADLDGDRDQDLVSAHGSPALSGATGLFQDSDGSLSRRVGWFVYPTTYNPQGLAVDDVTGDGHPDIVLAQREGGLAILRSGGYTPTPGGEALWVKDVAPADFTTDVALTTTPTITFQRPLDTSSVDATTVQLVNGSTGATVPAIPTYDAATRVVTITPASPLGDGTPYRIVVGAVKDTAGATNPTPFSTTFSPVDLAPGAVHGLTAAASNTTATLHWSLPDISDLDQVIVRSATGTTPPASPTTGTSVYAGTGTAATATGLAGTNTFRVWVTDRAGHLSTPADIRIAGGRLTTTLSPTTLTYGGTTTVTGKLVRSDIGAAITSATVQLLARQKGTTSWRLLGTRTTSTAGFAAIAHKPAAGYDYQWIYAGNSSLLGARSAVASVGVRPIVTASASASSIRLGGSVVINGGVTPAHPSQAVYLQRYVSGKWVGVATGRLSSRSTYSFTIKPTLRGTYAYRVARPADVDHLATTSVTRTVKVS